MTTALLIIDIQNDYFPGGAMELVGAEAAASKAKILLDKFRAEERPIIHIQHLSTRPDATFFLPGTKGAEIHRVVKPLKGEKVIVKHFPNAFYETDLLKTLQHLGVEQLVVVGMMTHMCVDTTVRAAKDLGFNCVVASDACATKDLEFCGDMVSAADVQTAFLSALSYYFSKVANVQQVLDYLKA